jgi:hypothetical protein
LRRGVLYVWSGSLRGVAVEASNAVSAVEKAVKSNLPCVLNNIIRVSLVPKGANPYDVYFEAPYEEKFPDLFDGCLDVQVGQVEES